MLFQGEKYKIIKAAENDNVHTLQELTSNGVDVTGIVAEVSMSVAIQCSVLMYDIV